MLTISAILDCQFVFWQMKRLYRVQIRTFIACIAINGITYIYTYVIGHYNPSVRIIDLVSHATCVVCVIFIHKCLDLQFKVDSERQIFGETFHGNFYILSEILPEICWEESAEEILFVFCFDVWPGARILAFRLISQHTTYQTTTISK